MSHTNNFRLVPLYALSPLGCVMSPHTRDGNLAFLPAMLENNLNIKMQRLGWGGFLPILFLQCVKKASMV